MPLNDKKEKPKENTIRSFQAPKGMHDILPADQPYWDRIEGIVKDLARSYGFSRLEPPVLEFADLYNKTSGDESDVVAKEMYTLRTKGGDLLALRPEYTPGMARAYLENSLSRLGQPQKLFHFGPVFRHDRPQLGRYRQFTQIGFETHRWSERPASTTPRSSPSMRTFSTELKIKNFTLKINSIGCRVCRPLYKKQLLNYYKNHERELCADCVQRLKTNPLRLLDCKEESCVKLKAKAPNFLDKLCSMCTEHFKSVLEYLEEIAIPYELDNHLVRGLDYYSRTVFEMYADGKEAEIGALPAGGRYDYLMEMIGGHLTPAVGAACGVERLIAVMKAKEIALPMRTQKKVFLAHAGDLAKQKAFALLKDLRARGISVFRIARKGIAWCPAQGGGQGGDRPCFDPRPERNLREEHHHPRLEDRVFRKPSRRRSSWTRSRSACSWT